MDRTEQLSIPATRTRSKLNYTNIFALLLTNVMTGIMGLVFAFSELLVLLEGLSPSSIFGLVN